MNPSDMIALRASLGRALGYGASFDGSVAAYAGLTTLEQIDLVNALKAYIRANPGEFNSTQRALAGTGTMESPALYTTGDKVADFFDEMGNQAVDINDAVNPFSEANRGWVLGMLAAGVAVYFLAPVIIAAVRAPAKAAASS